MKHLFLFIALTFGMSAGAQRIDSTISEDNFGTVNCEFQKVKEPGQPDRYYVFCSFKNEDYQYIIDIGSILLSSQVELDSFILDLESAYLLLLDKERQNATYERQEYMLCIYDFAPTTLYIYDSEDKKTTLPRRIIPDWIAWLKSVNFPS